MAVAHGLVVRSTSPKPIMKTRAAFCLVTTPLTRISRVGQPQLNGIVSSVLGVEITYFVISESIEFC